ncbi:MAG: hypothetical protein ACI3XR_05205 [Eubacteriales bacterium]
MDSIKKLIEAIDKLPTIAKLILCIPAVDIIWSIYRLLRSVVANNLVGIIVSAILILCAPFMWLIDLICIILKGKIWTID